MAVARIIPYQTFSMKHLLAILIFLGAAMLPGAVLFENGQAKSSIVVSDDAPAPVRRAASELALWLGKASGLEFPITAEPIDGLTPIYLGDSDFAWRNGFDRETLKPDGYLLKSTEDFLLIAGRDHVGKPLQGLIHPQFFPQTWNGELELSAFGEMGTLNGVERFLEEFAGVRWYMTGDLGTVVPPLERLEIPALEKTNAPEFEYRYAWLCDFPASAQDVLWYRRVGFGAPAPVSISHNYWVMQKHKDDHPEYFALIDGKRDFDHLSVIGGGGGYCLSNPGLQQAWIDFICDFFEAHPEYTLYPLCPNDGLVKICECPDCQALYSPELGTNGKFSNYIWNFTDKVARGVAERCPGKQVGTFAYERYRAVPTKPAELAPNVAVMICVARQTLANEKSKAEVEDTLRKWTERAKNVYLWTYPIFDYWMPWRGTPRFYPHLLQENFRLLHRLGAFHGEFLESESGSGSADPVPNDRIGFPGLAHLTAYITVKLLWDSQTDVDALLEEYYRLFYGAGADAMRQFWQKAEEIFLTRAGDHPVKVFKDKDIRQFFEWLDRAASAVAPDSLEAKRIALIRSEMEPYCRALMNLADAKRPLVATSVPELPLTRDLLHSAWRQAERTKLVAKDGTASEFDTIVLSAADAQGVGFTVICFEEEMAKLAVRAKTADDLVWEDDSVEFFFEGVDGTSGHHFILTADGVLWDSAWEVSNAPEEDGWQSNAVCDVWKMADRWVAQIKIPWSDLGIADDPTGKLVANIYRNRVCGGAPRHAAFTPTMTDQHRRTDFFGKLEVK